MTTNNIVDNFPLSLETELIIKACLEVHKHLGHGFLEIVYKDALELEFQKNNLFFEREKKFPVHYKSILLDHRFYFIEYNYY